MKRGITQISGKELSFALEAVKNNQYTNQILIDRLTPKKIDDNKVQIQLDEDQAEIILDSLPTPDQTEATELTSLRKTIQQFISKLRFPTKG